MDRPPQCIICDVSCFNNKFTPLTEIFSAMHIDVHSMKNKPDCLYMFLGSINRPFDVLLFIETWLTSHDDHLLFKNYQYHGILRSNMRGGGLALYVNSCYPQCVLDEISVTNSNLECLAVSWTSVIVAFVYRPPAGNKLLFFKFRESLLLNPAYSWLPFVIMGDINTVITVRVNLIAL